MSERGFSFIPRNARGEKLRTRGITEIRGPYYTPMGIRYLEDILETMGEYVDSLKLCSWSACAQVSGEPRASGAGS